VTVRTQVRDPAAVAAACACLGLPAPAHGTDRFYASEATGLLLHLPGWRYPAVLDTTTGALHSDTFAGRGGDPRQLDRFLQAYAVEKVRLEARKKGYALSEAALPDGSVRLQIVDNA
jgi:hypothetical protein